MNADTKHHNVMVAIQVIHNAISELRKVANADGLRGHDVMGTIDSILEFVDEGNGNDPPLGEWLEWLEADLEPEAK